MRDKSMPMMCNEVHWSAFQSVAQLSVALNATFAAIATFLGGDFEQEERRIRQAIHFANKQPGAADQPSTGSRLKSLSGSLALLQRRFELMVDFVVRPLCVVGVIVGFGVLVYSSYHADNDVHFWGLLVTFASTAPFLIGFLGSIAVSLWVNLVYARRRLRLENL